MYEPSLGFKYQSIGLLGTLYHEGRTGANIRSVFVLTGTDVLVIIKCEHTFLERGVRNESIY